MNNCTFDSKPAAAPILFLAIDGVMTTAASAIQNRSGLVFSRTPVMCLNRILAQTACRVVLTTSWRTETRIDLGSIFEVQGVTGFRKRLAGTTPDLSREERTNRADEIEAWLIKERFHGRLAILDEDRTSGLFAPWHCRTSDEPLSPPVAHRVIQTLLHGPIYRQEVAAC